MDNINQFYNLFPVSKTLRMKLIPIGRTLETIQKCGILEEDQHRSESYVLVKKIIDDYHKAYIESALTHFQLKTIADSHQDSLEEFYMYYFMNRKDEKVRTVYEKVQTQLRKQIAKQLTKSETYKRIGKKEMIQSDLIEFVKSDPECDKKTCLLEEFKNFVTYFGGFHENRQNMYSDEPQSTAIAYRLVHENLPKFIDNMTTFEIISKTPVAAHFAQLFNDFKENLKVDSIQNLFQLSYFNTVLTQKQIDIYNAVIGGKMLDDKNRIQGLNEYINLYNQTHKEGKLPLFKLLFKQILSDRVALSWLPEAFHDDNQALHSLQDCYDDLNEYVLGDTSLKPLLQSLASYDLSRIYVSNDLSLTDISQKHYGNWSIIPLAIKNHLKNQNVQKKKESAEAYQNRIEKLFKISDSYSLAFINDCLVESGIVDKKIEDFYVSLGAVNTCTEQRENIFLRIQNAYTEVSDLLQNEYPKDKNLMQDKQGVEKIKTLLDELKELQHFIKPLLGKGNESDKDERFYGEFLPFWTELEKVTPLYNMVRNYVTRKPYSNEKIKVNFQNSTLLSGWDRNKEKDNFSIILRKNGLYYLAIMRKQYNKIFEKYPAGNGSDYYEKMDYKLLPGANKMLPKVFFSKSRIDEFQPSKELLVNYEKGTHKKGDAFSLEDCHALIDFFKSSIKKHEDWKQFDFQFSPTETYEDMSGFYREVEQQGYKLTFNKISAKYIDQLVEDGKLFLFQIYNKDFSSCSKGTPNLHTLYWKMLFDDVNLKDVVYKLNGAAEIFFRKSSLSYTRPTHPAHLPIKNKNIHNSKKESVFGYDLVKHRRYTVDSFHLHVPITMNFKGAGWMNLNELVNDYLHKSEDVHVIGIDRGERHLLYLVVIDKYGRIIEQFSLNEIVNEYQGNTYATNYHDLLEQRENERKQARQSWQSIENIKELKEGYLSQVIHKIAELIVKYNAIVALEDLNMGFMRGRQQVEKQVYQKFERMLIDKLNYLVDKKKDADAHGGLLKAYQLTNKFESFQKLGKQSGFLFYVPAWNTSKIDPYTGFVNLLDARYESVEKAKSFLCKLDAIRYNAEQDYFEFYLDYDNFNQRAEGTRTKWTVCTYGTRIDIFRNPDKLNQWDHVEVNLTEQFKVLFNRYDIDITGNLKESIAMQEEKAFFETLMHLFKLTLQMRNSKTGTEIDYLLSPVANEDGRFYDSRVADLSLPNNADANGAYNIARKGLWVIRQIKQGTDIKKVKLAISNKEWLQFAQEKPYLKDE